MNFWSQVDVEQVEMPSRPLVVLLILAVAFVGERRPRRSAPPTISELKAAVQKYSPEDVHEHTPDAAERERSKADLARRGLLEHITGLGAVVDKGLPRITSTVAGLGIAVHHDGERVRFVEIGAPIVNMTDVPRAMEAIHAIAQATIGENIEAWLRTAVGTAFDAYAKNRPASERVIEGKFDGGRRTAVLGRAARSVLRVHLS